MTFQWWHVLLALLPILLNLWGLWHVWSHDFGGDFQRKVLWLLCCVFLPVLGGLIYLVAGRPSAGARIARPDAPGGEG